MSDRREKESAIDPLLTLACGHSLLPMIRSAFYLAVTAVINSSSAALATPPPPPAPNTWIRFAWECPGKSRSFIEIERLGQGSSGYQTKIIGLEISGRKIDPATVDGLEALMARRNFLRPVGGYCENTGETIGIEELASGPKSTESGWRGFYVPYEPRD